MFLWKCLKFNADSKNSERNWEKEFCFWDECLWIVCMELFLQIREYLPSAVNVLTKSLKTFDVTKSDFSNSITFAIINQYYKGALIKIEPVFPPVSHVVYRAGLYLTIGHLSINSVRNKFSSLQQTVLNKTDILLLSETKIDDSFPNSQFYAEGFKMYCKDRTKTGGGLLLYVNENLPGKIINSYKFKENSEIIVFEFSVSNKNWILLGNYKPPSQNDLSIINELNLALNFFSPIYENFVFLGDFNLSTENPNLKNFMCSFDLERLINSPTCYKSTNPSCIDLILTNKKNHFMKSATFETGLSDHHKLLTTILRKNYK